MAKELVEQLEKGRITRRSFLKGMGLAAGTVALTSVFDFRGFGQAPIRIGMLNDYTGALASFGPDFERAAKLALDHINAAGGPLGRPLEIIFRDSGTSVDMGRDAATKLVEIDNVPAIVGSLASGVTIACSSITIPAKVVLISPASTSVAITDLEDDDYVFRTTMNDRGQAPVLAREALNRGLVTVSTIFVNNAYGRGLAELFKKHFEEGGGRVLANLPYEENKPSYRGEVAEALSGSPEGFLLIGYPGDGNKILVEAAGQGFTGKILLTDGMEGEDVVGNGPAGEYLRDRNFGTTHGALETEGGRLYLAAFQEKYGRKPEPPFTQQVYDAFATIALAIQKAGEATGPAIRDALRYVANKPGDVVTVGEFSKAFDLLKANMNINYEGANGPIAFDVHGDTTVGAIAIYEYQFDPATGRNREVTVGSETADLGGEVEA